MNKHARVFISGRVQGVGFRMYAVDQAEQLKVTGWVKNCSDGRVEIIAEGDEADVDAFVDWCRTGPESAEVAGVKVTYSDATGEFDEFVIRYAH